MLPGPKLSTTVDVATKSAAYNYPVGTIVTGGTILVLVGCLVGPAIELAINLIDSGIDMLVSSAPAPEEVNPADMVSDSEDEDEPGSKKAGYSSDNESLDSQPGLRTGSQLEL